MEALAFVSTRHFKGIIQCPKCGYQGKVVINEFSSPAETDEFEHNLYEKEEVVEAKRRN